MQDENPYASPLFPNENYSTNRAQNSPDDKKYRVDVFRDGKLLVMRKNAQLPDRCVKSNEPAAEKLQRKLTWVPKGKQSLYLIAFGALLAHFLLKPHTQKATIHVGLSEKWLRKRRRAIILGWTLPILGFLLIIAAAILTSGPRGEDTPYIIGLPIGVIMILGGILYGTNASKIVTPERITDRFVWLKGVHRDYLAELPEFPYVE
jgi:hypothetical protein